MGPITRPGRRCPPHTLAVASATAEKLALPQALSRVVRLVRLQVSVGDQRNVDGHEQLHLTADLTVRKVDVGRSPSGSHLPTLAPCCSPLASA
jgi:hypothetical protein